MPDEFQSLIGTHTWTVLERPKDRNVIPGKWVYKGKTKPTEALRNIRRVT